MSRFNVIWWRFARAKLADLWLEATDKLAVTAAANEIDRLLADDPAGCAEASHEGLYRLTIKPLTVQYSVEAAKRRVVRVWTVRRSDVQSAGP